MFASVMSDERHPDDERNIIINGMLPLPVEIHKVFTPHFGIDFSSFKVDGIGRIDAFLSLNDDDSTLTRFRAVKWQHDEPRVVSPGILLVLLPIHRIAYDAIMDRLMITVVANDVPL